MEFTSYLFGCISTFSREIASEVGNSNTYRAIQALVQDWSIIKWKSCGTDPTCFWHPVKGEVSAGI